MRTRYTGSLEKQRATILFQTQVDPTVSLQDQMQALRTDLFPYHLADVLAEPLGLTVASSPPDRLRPSIN
jgi:hypothetical protein